MTAEDLNASTSGEAQFEAEGAQDSVQAGQAGVPTARKLAVEALAVQAGEAGGTSHAALRFHHVPQPLQKDIRAFLVTGGQVFGGLIRVGQVVFQNLLKSHGSLHTLLTFSLLVIAPVLLGLADVTFMRPLVAAAEQNHQRLALLPEINPVARPVIHPRLGHPFAHRLTVTKASTTDA